MGKNMLHIRPVTAGVGPRILLSGIVFTGILIGLALLTAFVLASLPEERFPFWTSAEGIAVAEIALVLVLSFGLLPALLLWFSTGRITVDSSGMRWNIRGEKGEIRWDRPFSIRRWQSVMTATVHGDSGPPGEQAFPLIVYEVSQGNARLVFYRGAGFDEVKGLPAGERAGVMLFQRARRLTRTIDAVTQRKLGTEAPFPS